MGQLIVLQHFCSGRDILLPLLVGQQLCSESWYHFPYVCLALADSLFLDQLPIMHVHYTNVGHTYCTHVPSALTQTMHCAARKQQLQQCDGGVIHVYSAL